jgi:leucyl aminopeptidase
MLACYTSEQYSAIRITPVGEAALPGWLDAHPDSREWISAVGFKAEPGTFAFLASNNGGPSGLIASPTEVGSVWAFAGLPAALPEGTFSGSADFVSNGFRSRLGAWFYAFCPYGIPNACSNSWPAKADRGEVGASRSGLCARPDQHAGQNRS